MNLNKVFKLKMNKNIIICSWKFADGKTCTFPATNGGFCLTHYNLNIEKKGKEEFEKLINSDETKECASKAHFVCSSPYPKENIPLKEFVKEMKGGKIKICNTCSYCRNKRTDARVRKKNERREENLKEDIVDSDYRVCISECHDTASEYPRNKVPLHLFLGRTKTKIYEDCSDCREHVNKNNMRNRELKTKEDYTCKHCGKTGGIDLRGVNLDGTPSSRCTFCKESQIKFNKVYREKRKDILKKVKIKMIKEIGSCCNKCDSIFLISHDNDPYKELKTFYQNNIKSVKYLDKAYPVDEFFEKFEDILELDMIEFDHLTEEEQRERNIIKPEESFIKKKNSVTSFRTEWDIIQEAKITQILCSLCHMKETIFREKGFKYKGFAKVKHEYVNNLKIEKKGCEICGFFDPELLRYLEFDHLEPKNKIDNICNMVNYNKYSLEDVEKECGKCRLLCKMCHKLHTYKQIKEGVFREAHRNFPLIDYYPLE